MAERGGDTTDVDWDERLRGLVTRAVTTLHEGTINLEQASREARARYDKKIQEETAKAQEEERSAQARLNRAEAELARQQKLLDESERKLEERTRQRDQWIKEKERELRKLEQKNEALKNKNQKRARAAASIKACLAKIGLSFAKVHEESDETYIGMQGLGGSGGDSDPTFYLCFAQLGGLDKFNVLRAQPTFPEFEKLAKETNEAQDLIKLLMESRRCWTRDYVNK